MQTKKLIPSLDDIYNIYSTYVPVDIKSNTRLREVVDYRVFFFKLCLDYTDETNSRIAAFANRHHSTVNHYVNNFESFSLNNKKAYNLYVRVEKELIDKFPILLERYESTPGKLIVSEIPKTFAKKYEDMINQLDFYMEKTVKLERKIEELTLKIGHEI